MSIRRQLELVVAACLLGFLVYAVANSGQPIPAWLYGVVFGAAFWGLSFSNEQTRNRQKQILNELQGIRATLSAGPAKE